MTSTNNNLVTPNNLFALENEVMADLTNFNRIYQLYLTCNKNQSMFGNSDCTSDSAPSLANVITAYNKLTDTTSESQGSLVRLQNAIDSLKSTDGNTNNVGTTQAQYIANYNYIMNNYKNVVKKRQALDSSLAELYEIGDTSSKFYQKKLISTSFTKILLTVLATTLTIGAFMTIRKK